MGIKPQLSRNIWLRRNRIVKRAIERPQNFTVLQFRKPLVERIVEPELAFFHEDQGADCRNRLRYGHKPENRVSPHRCVVVKSHPAHRLQALAAAVMDKCDKPGQQATFDMPSQGCLHSVQPYA